LYVSAKSILSKNHVREHIEKSLIENVTSNLLFNLSSISTFGIVKRISNSIGSSKLANTFDDIQVNHPYNSVKIINASIALDHHNSFPSKDIFSLAKENEKNSLAFNTLQNLVIDHLYMYEVPLEQKQQIYSKLNIKIKEQRFIDATSQIKKEVIPTK
jgi:hypothetical protein